MARDPFKSNPPVGPQKKREKTGPVIKPSNHQEAHTQSDVDTSSSAQHHTLGLGANQAFSGSEGAALKQALGAMGKRVAYNPTWVALSGSAPDVGNGSLVGEYFLIGDLCFTTIILTAGTTTALGSTGSYVFGLPFPGIAPVFSDQILDGNVEFLNTAVAFHVGMVRGYSSNLNYVEPLVFAVGSAGAVGLWSNTNPFTLGATDIIKVNCSYRWQ